MSSSLWACWLLSHCRLPPLHTYRPLQGSGSALHEAAWCGQAAVVSLMMRTNGHHDRVTPKNHYR